MRTVFNGSNTKLAVANMSELISALDDRVIGPFPLDGPHEPSPVAQNRLCGVAGQRMMPLVSLARCESGIYVLNGMDEISACRMQSDACDMPVIVQTTDMTLDMAASYLYAEGGEASVEQLVKTISQSALLTQEPLRAMSRGPAARRAIALSLLLSAAGIPHDVDVAQMERLAVSHGEQISQHRAVAMGAFARMSEGFELCTPLVRKNGRTVHYMCALARLLLTQDVPAEDVAALTTYLFARGQRDATYNRTLTNVESGASLVRRANYLRLLVAARAWEVTRARVNVYLRYYVHLGQVETISQDEHCTVPVSALTPSELNILAGSIDKPLHDEAVRLYSKNLYYLGNVL